MYATANSIYIFRLGKGAIFDENNYEMEVAFYSAVNRENMYNKNIEFVPKVERAPAFDSFMIEKKGIYSFEFNTI